MLHRADVIRRVAFVATILLHVGISICQRDFFVNPLTWREDGSLVAGSAPIFSPAVRTSQPRRDSIVLRGHGNTTTQGMEQTEN